ncbi:hypothetical protein P3S68_019442 [Capsicum galapagoense]
MSMTDVADFQNCITTTKLKKLANIGCNYTWKDKGEDSRVFLKIDWAFKNGEWLDDMPDCREHFLKEGVSDHSPIYVKLEGVQTRRKTVFKYCNMWSTHPSYTLVVQGEWHIQIQGKHMFSVVNKLKRLKAKLRNLHDSYFKNIMNEVSATRRKLLVAQEKLQVDPLSLQLQEEENIASRVFKRTSYVVEMTLAKISKNNWLRLGDENTK